MRWVTRKGPCSLGLVVKHPGPHDLNARISVVLLFQGPTKRYQYLFVLEGEPFQEYIRALDW